MTTDQILCQWAEEKYGLHGVERVVLDEDYDDGYSEYTPGEGWYVDIGIYGAGDKRLRTEHRSDAVALIREVCQFACRLMDDAARERANSR